MGPSDEVLVEAFQAGDIAAFDDLVRRWDRKIQGAIYRIMGSEEEARDLCQEAFLKAYRALPGFKGEARFSSWLYQIALNLCRDRMRRRKGKTLVSLDEVSEGGVSLREAGPSALEIVEANDRYQDLTFQEVAGALGLPVSTVKTRLYRGLQQLRDHLQRQGLQNSAPVPEPSP
jgi:RNA polymerase sigma-70 factor (ECF subfamily)